ALIGGYEQQSITKEEKKKTEEKKPTYFSNLFNALAGEQPRKNMGKKTSEGKERMENWWPAKESFVEEAHLRPLTEEKAKEITFRVFDVYKKAHGMPSYT
ncbi:MAG: hypothetical protein U1B79_00925, partial [Candidatus Pacearchaeota archaeon]|nr:hypothetical protein [Candidatus Pacearchaeota archaeon]